MTNHQETPALKVLIGLLVGEGAKLTRAMRALVPNAQLLVFTEQPPPVGAVGGGAGFVAKAATVDILVEAIHYVHEGETPSVKSMPRLAFRPRPSSSGLGSDLRPRTTWPLANAGALEDDRGPNPGPSGGAAARSRPVVSRAEGHSIRSRSGQAGPIVVWMRGEHDISTDGQLRYTLARAIARENSGLVLDLSKVRLVSASTLGVILVARELLSRQSRSLTVRSPSASVRRIIAVCGLDDLFGPSLQEELGGAGKALGPWMVAPAAKAVGREPHTPSAPALVCLPGEVGHATHLAAPVTKEPERLAEIA
jgi:anti-anti-sigma factor